MVNKIKFCVWLPRPKGGEAKSSATVFVVYYNSKLRGDKKMRLFIAAQFNQKIIDELTYIQSYWQHLGMKGRYAPVENLHLTLAFIGEYKDPDYVLETLEAVSFEPFSVKLDGVGNFNDLYWAGVQKNEELSTCVKRIRRALAENNIPYDRKRFSPHITLVRKAAFEGKPENLTKELPTGEMKVNSIAVMSSTRGKNGMIYTKIGSLQSNNSGITKSR